MKESVLPSSPEELKEAIVIASSRENWDQVEALVPFASDMNGDTLIHLFYPCTRSDNSNIRDGAMMVWFYIKPNSVEVKHIHWGRALDEMVTDVHECAAVWAAATACRYIGDPDPYFSEPAMKQLELFGKRIKKMDEKEGNADWQQMRNFVVAQTKEITPQLVEFI